MTTSEIAKLMLQATLSQSSEVLDELYRELTDLPAYFLIAAPDTTREQWERKHFAAHIDRDRDLVAFIDPQNAGEYARVRGSVLDGQAMVTKSSVGSFSKIVAEYESSRLIDGVKVYSRPPLFSSFAPRAFLAIPGRNGSDIMAYGVDADGCYSGVDIVRQALDIYETRERRRLDPGARYENSHTLIASLMQQNNLTCEFMDKTLDLNQGYTREYISGSIKSTNPSIETLTKYLSFFGLQEYLYVYKADSTELSEYIRSHPSLDKYKIVKATSPSDDVYKLYDIRRGRDETNGAFVYRMTMKKENMPTNVVVSSPLGYVIGKEYRVIPMEEYLSPSKPAASSKPLTKVHVPDAESMEAELKDLTRPEASPESYPYETQRYNDLIKYFRTNDKIDQRTAASRVKSLEAESSILDEFYKYTQTGRLRCTPVEGYTAQKLVDKLQYTPYEAYLMLVQLRTDTKRAKQELKYRETEPQYQKPAK